MRQWLQLGLYVFAIFLIGLSNVAGTLLGALVVALALVLVMTQKEPDMVYEKKPYIRSGKRKAQGTGQGWGMSVTEKQLQKYRDEKKQEKK